MTLINYFSTKTDVLPSGHLSDAFFLFFFLFLPHALGLEPCYSFSGDSSHLLKGLLCFFLFRVPVRLRSLHHIFFSLPYDLDPADISSFNFPLPL